MVKMNTETNAISFPVPQPRVNVTLSRPAPLYVGTPITRTCIVTLDPNVDIGDMVMTSWTAFRGTQVHQYSVANNNFYGNTYANSLTTGNLQETDSGTYRCSVTVTGGNNVQQATASADVNITVMGERVHFVGGTLYSPPLFSLQLPQLQWCPYLLPVDPPLLARPTPSLALCRLYHIYIWRRSPVLSGPGRMALCSMLPQAIVCNSTLTL